MDKAIAQTIRCELDAGILTITLARPAQMNAFTVAMAEELIQAVTQASDDDAVRVVIVTGEGRAFCAGMDLATTDGDNVFGLDESLRPTMQDLDERLDDPQIVPDACSSWFLPRVVGLPRALQWTFSGELIATPEALASSLVSQVVAPEQLLVEARRVAHQVSDARSPVSVALIRQMMYRNSAAPDPLQAHKVESLGVFYTSLADGTEGVAAFLGKRDPAFIQAASEMPDFYPWWK